MLAVGAGAAPVGCVGVVHVACGWNAAVVVFLVWVFVRLDIIALFGKDSLSQSSWGWFIV